MGTTLTGTKPKDTYDSLIKVEDNGPISGTAKYLSDGLGNNLPIAVSTSNVGIGTSAPAGKLSVADASLSTLALTATGEATDQKTWVYQYGAAVGAGTFRLRASNDAVSNGQNAVIITRTGFNVDTHQFLTSGSERVRITDNGVTFNGDTAAANALDDYEEGTWTMGVSFGGASVGVTTSLNGGTYTKIGRQVTVNGLLSLTSKGSSTGAANITGLPFTIANNNANYSAASFRFNNITFSGQFLGYGEINSTIIDLNEITILGALTAITDADFANNSTIIVSFTYFV